MWDTFFVLIVATIAVASGQELTLDGCFSKYENTKLICLTPMEVYKNVASCTDCRKICMEYYGQTCKSVQYQESTKQCSVFDKATTTCFNLTITVVGCYGIPPSMVHNSPDFTYYILSSNSQCNSASPVVTNSVPLLAAATTTFPSSMNQLETTTLVRSMNNNPFETSMQSSSTVEQVVSTSTASFSTATTSAPTDVVMQTTANLIPVPTTLPESGPPTLGIAYQVTTTLPNIPPVVIAHETTATVQSNNNTIMPFQTIPPSIPPAAEATSDVGHQPSTSVPNLNLVDMENHLSTSSQKTGPTVVATQKTPIVIVENNPSMPPTHTNVPFAEIPQNVAAGVAKFTATRPSATAQSVTLVEVTASGMDNHTPGASPNVPLSEITRQPSVVVEMNNSTINGSVPLPVSQVEVPEKVLMCAQQTTTITNILQVASTETNSSGSHFNNASVTINSSNTSKNNVTQATPSLPDTTHNAIRSGVNPCASAINANHATSQTTAVERNNSNAVPIPTETSSEFRNLSEASTTFIPHLRHLVPLPNFTKISNETSFTDITAEPTQSHLLPVESNVLNGSSAPLELHVTENGTTNFTIDASRVGITSSIIPTLNITKSFNETAMVSMVQTGVPTEWALWNLTDVISTRTPTKEPGVNKSSNLTMSIGQPETTELNNTLESVEIHSSIAKVSIETTLSTSTVNHMPTSTLPPAPMVDSGISSQTKDHPVEGNVIDEKPAVGNLSGCGTGCGSAKVKPNAPQHEQKIDMGQKAMRMTSDIIVTNTENKRRFNRYH